MNKNNYDYVDERCIPDSVLYQYKIGAIKDAGKLKDIKQHLNECAVCKKRLKTIEKDIERELIQLEKIKKTVKVPDRLREYIKEHQSSIRTKNTKKSKQNTQTHRPKRGDIYLARGNEYFWQMSKIVLIINYIKDEDLYYVVPLDNITIYGTDLDVIIKDKNGTIYMADCSSDNNLFRYQLKKKIGEVDEEQIRNISKMILYIAGKDVDISDIPRGLEIIHEDDQRIPFIETREKSLKQLFQPYMEYVASEINSIEKQPQNKPEGVPIPQPQPLSQIPVIEVPTTESFSMAASSLGVAAFAILPGNIISSMKNIISHAQKIFTIKKTKNAYIGIYRKKGNIYLIYKGVDLIEYLKDNKWNNGKIPEGKITIGKEKQAQNIQIHYRIGQIDERRELHFT